MHITEKRPISNLYRLSDIVRLVKSIGHVAWIDEKLPVRSRELELTFMLRQMVGDK
jgi:hypothetical protein